MEKKMRDIKYLVMDVDGTLTDGKIYMGAQGEVCKAFKLTSLLLLLQEENHP